MNETKNQIFFELNFYTTLVLTIICLIGNPLVIYIFSRPKFLKVSMFRYWIAIAIADTLNLLSNWPSVYPDEFLVNEHSISCKIFYYLYYALYQMTPWILVLSSVDRLLSVRYPTALKFRNSFKYQLLAITCIIAFISLANIPIYLYHDIKDVYGCVTTNDKLQIYLDLMNALVMTLIPFFAMVVTTGLIWHQLIDKKKKLKQENRKRYKKDVQLIKILCIMATYFLLSNLPYCIYMVVCDLLQINAFETLGLYIVNTLSYGFSACDFFIYFIFNKLFRSYFLTMIKLKKKNRKNNSKSINK